MAEVQFQLPRLSFTAKKLDEKMAQKRQDERNQKLAKLAAYTTGVIQMFNEEAADASEWPIEIHADPVCDDDDALAILEPMFKANGFVISVYKSEPGHFVIRKAE